MDLGIRDRVALVAASSRGLGRASAMALAGEGAAVVVTGRDGAAVEACVADVVGAGGEALGIAGDVTGPDVPGALVDATVARYDRIDIVVANAGGPPPGGALDVSDGQLEAAVNGNFYSAVRLVRAALPHMRSAGWGRICCIASYSVVQPIPDLSLSNAARSALRAWAKTAAADLGADPADITLNLACPGLHATDRMVELARRRPGGQGTPATAPRMGAPDDFGAVVAFLCSAQARFVNGATIVVDGGESLAL